MVLLIVYLGCYFAVLGIHCCGFVCLCGLIMVVFVDVVGGLWLGFRWILGCVD